MKRIVILGGGFGGLEAARSARKHFDGEIVLIDHSPVMTMHAHLHELVSERIKKEEIEIKLKKTLEKIGVGFMQAEIGRLKKGYVETNKGKIKYDSLIIAMGSKTCFRIKGISTCDELKQSFHANTMHDHLMKLDDAKIVVVGAGLTGTELVFEIAELGRKHNKNFKVHLVEVNEKPMPNFPKKAQDIAQKKIEAEKITTHYGHKIVFSTLKQLKFDNGIKLDYDLLIWTAGIEPVPNVKTYGLQSSNGFIKVNNNLETSAKGVFAIGDIAWFGIGQSHELWTAVTAMKEGKIAGENAANYLKEKPLKKYVPEKKHLFLVSLGKKSGLLVRGNFVMHGLLPLQIKTLFRKWYMKSRT